MAPGGRRAAPAAIHRKSPSGGNRMGIGCADHERAQPPELFLKQACGTIAAERTKAVAADQLGEIAAVMGR